MKREIHPSYYSGLSGLQLPVPKHLFPIEFQATSRLTYYASLLNSIEINSSFYKMPQEKTVAKWAASVPDHFKFTFKLSKQITHSKYLKFDDVDIKRFINTINHVGDKKGCLLIQFPPSLKSEAIDQVVMLLEGIKEADTNNDWHIAFEFRNVSWYTEEVYEILNSYNSCVVMHDKSGSPAPFLSYASVNFVYIRFHGPSGNYRGSYTTDFLSEYSAYIKSWLAESKTVYIYFNNTMGDAFGNLTALNKFILEDN